jgi:hypothetical protein
VDDSADPGDSSTEAITTRSSLVGAYTRASANDPILGLTFAGHYGTKDVSFSLVLDPQLVPGACAPAATAPCEGSFLEGTLSAARGSSAKGSFTLVPRDPASVPAATKAYLDKHTFTRSPAGLVIHNVQTLMNHALLPLESPLKGAPKEIAGTWDVDDQAPAGAGVYATITFTPGPALSGTFTAKRYVGAGALPVSGTYEVGEPNAMIGLAPLTLHPTGGADLSLFVGAGAREASGAFIDLGVVVANQPSIGFSYKRAAAR